MAIYDISIKEFNALAEAEQKKVLKAAGKLVDVILTKAKTSGTMSNAQKAITTNYGSNYKFEKVKAPQGVTGADYLKAMQTVINEKGVRKRKEEIKAQAEKKKAEKKKAKEAIKGSVKFVDEKGKEVKPKKYKKSEFKRLQAQAEGKTSVMPIVGKKRLEKYKAKVQENRLQGRLKSLQDAGYNVSRENAEDIGLIFKALREDGILNVSVDSDSVYDLVKQAPDRASDVKEVVNFMLSTKDGNIKKQLIDMLKMDDIQVFYPEYVEEEDDTDMVNSLLGR